MEQTKITISPYHVWWVNIQPIQGIVTQHDQRAIGAFYVWPNLKEFNKHFVNRAEAVDYLVKFSKKLDKRYICRLCTDKQMSMSKEGRPQPFTEKRQIPFTAKQLSEVYYIW